MKFYCFLLLNFGFLAYLSGQDAPLPQSYNPSIYCAQSYPKGNPLGYPFYELGTTDGLQFEFDLLEQDAQDFGYAVFLCTHDWQISALSTSDYMQGFTHQNITDVQSSFNTLIEYHHYTFVFPNDMMRLKLSGNYLLAVYEGDDPEDRSQWHLAYRMIAFEQLVNLSANVQPSSVIAQRFKQQEVDFSLQHPDYSIYDYRNDLHCSIYQNMDWRTGIHHLAPVFIKGTELIYDFNLGENAFSGGAEYRNFEFKSLQYQSSAVDHIDRQDDGYHIYLRTDQSTGNRAQSSGIDINGNYFIRNDQGQTDALESEYVWIHFSLALPEMTDTEIILDGMYFRMLQHQVTLHYNATSRQYEGATLMKQGLYDYRYMSQDAYQVGPVLDYTEGNNTGTENTYYIVVYNNDRQTGSDRVVALNHFKSNR